MILVQDAGQATARPLISHPGVWSASAMPAAVYHSYGDMALSASGAKLLLDCPAKYKHRLDNPEPYKKAFEHGTAAHALVLGEGPELVEVAAEEWRTNAVKAEVAAIRESGRIPLRPSDYAQVHAMAAALRSHEHASALLDPLRGEPETSLFWQCGELWLRGRLDWLEDGPRPSGRLLQVDYKAVASAHPRAIAKAMADYGWHISAANYIDGINATHYDGDVAYMLLCQEKTAPYLVTIARLTPYDLEVGRRAMDRAIEMWRDCQASGIWPGYGAGEAVVEINLPRWADNYLEESW
jgi:hypothetical protein